MRNLLVIRLHFENFQQFTTNFKNWKSAGEALPTFSKFEKKKCTIRLFLKDKRKKKLARKSVQSFDIRSRFEGVPASVHVDEAFANAHRREKL